MNAGLGTMVRIHWQVQRRSILIWVTVLASSMVGTAVSIAGIYDSTTKIQSYANAVTGDALLAINGRVEGIDSLGGIIQDEFGFLAAFMMPLLGISLMAALTRRDEEAGRLEILLSGRISRHVPSLAACIVTTAAIVATGVAFSFGLAAEGVPLFGAILYSASLVTLAFAFAGIAAVFAQITLHTRSVYSWSLVILGVSYIARGVGDVTESGLTWLSPLGWAEKVAPFGPQRWWVLAIPTVVGAGGGAAAVLLASRRDLGSALIRGGKGPERASRRLRSGFGLATWIHRPAVFGWLAGSALLAGMMGSLAQQLLDAMAGNPALADAIGASGGRPEDGFIAMTQLYLAILGSGYVAQAVGTLRAEEAAGRVEPVLAGMVSRRRWLLEHAVVILAGLVGLNIVGSLILAVTAAWSTGSTSAMGSIVAAGVAYLPAQLVLAGVAFVAYGQRPRLFAVAWFAFATTTFIAFLGPGLQLPALVRDLAPTTHVGNPPLGSVEPLALAVLGCLAVVLFVVAFVGFARRTIPQS